MSINRVLISGNLTRDPEIRVTAGGTQILSFGVAVNDRRRNQQTGEWEDYPNFVDCVMFGARAEAVSRFLSKGSKVAIEGKLRYSSWERDCREVSRVPALLPPWLQLQLHLPQHHRHRVLFIRRLLLRFTTKIFPSRNECGIAVAGKVLRHGY